MSGIQIIALILFICNIVAAYLIIRYSRKKDYPLCDYCGIHEGKSKECPHIRRKFGRSAECNCCEACARICYNETMDDVERDFYYH